MSSSTISLQVRPGAEIARRIAEHRAEMGERRERLREQRAPVRERELMARGVSGARALARLSARADAIARETSPAERKTLREALERAARRGALEQAEETLTSVERAAEQRSGTRAAQEVILQAAVASFPGADALEPGPVVEGSDGRLGINTRLGNGGQLPLLACKPNGEEQRLTLVLAGSGLDRLGTERGLQVGCAAQEAFAQQTCENLRAQGIHATVERERDTGVAPAQQIARRSGGLP
jgi:hypothetical protein